MKDLFWLSDDTYAFFDYCFLGVSISLIGDVIEESIG